MAKLANRAKMTSATTGTGTITLGSAVDGYQTFAAAGVADADVVRYVIEDGTSWEIGTGTYTASGTTLSRTPSESSNAGAAISLSGSAVVYVSATAEDIPSPTLTIDNKTGAYTVVADDLGKIINCTSGTFTVSLTSAATLGAGFNVTIWNTSDTSTNAITIDPDGSETVDGKATVIVRRGEGLQVVSDGTNWQTGDKKAMRGYADNIPSTYAAVASGNISLAVGGRATASGSLRSIAIGDLTTASGTESFAVQNNATASGTGALAIGRTTTASSNYAVAMGNNSVGSGSQAVTGSGAMALGGSYASGTDSFAAAIANNTSSYGATGANSVAMGDRAKASGTDAIAIGASSTASGSQSFAAGFGHNAGSARAVVLGYQSSATSTGAIAIGNSCASSQGYAISLGNGASAAVYGKMAHSADTFAVQGDAQSGQLVLNAASSDATPVVMTSNGLTGFLSNNQIILPNNSAYAFHGTIVARQQASAGTACAAWKIEGLIRREGSAGTTVLVNSATTVIDNTPSWGMALSADTTNGGLAITVTGAAATNIRWVATIHTSECSY